VVDSKQRKLTTEGRGTDARKKITFRLNEDRRRGEERKRR